MQLHCYYGNTITTLFLLSKSHLDDFISLEATRRLGHTSNTFLRQLPWDHQSQWHETAGKKDQHYNVEGEICFPLHPLCIPAYEQYYKSVNHFFCNFAVEFIR